MARCGCSGQCSCKIVDGTNTTVAGTGTASDPYVISASGGGGGGSGTVESVVPGDGIAVDDSDPTAPVVSLAQQGATDGQVLTWVDSAGKYQPADASGGGTTVTSADITDASTIGKTILTAADAAAVRSAAGAAATTTTVDGQALSGNVETRLIPTAVKTAAYAAQPRDLVLADATAGTFAVTLPTAPGDLTTIAVKKIDNSANTPTVACGGTDTFESGATSFAISTQWREVVFEYHSGVWYAVGMYLSVASLAIPNDFSDLAGAVAEGQLPASAVMYQPFTDSNYNTAPRPTARTDVLVIWVGDSTTTSARLPTNRIAGDVSLTSQS